MNGEPVTVGTGRRVFSGAVLACILAAVGYGLFYYGRQHKVIIDNRAAEQPDGKSLRALAGAVVAVNRDSLEVGDGPAVPAAAPRPFISFKFWPAPDPSIAEAVEMMPRERILVKVLGPEFRLKSEELDRSGQPVGTRDTVIRLGARRDAMVRLVKLHAGLPDYLEDFPNDAASRPKPEEPEPANANEDAPPSMGDV